MSSIRRKTRPPSWASIPSYRDILLAAIGLEKDSIVFYLMMKPFVPESLGGSKVETILNEEATHVAILNKELGQVR